MRYTYTKRKRAKERRKKYRSFSSGIVNYFDARERERKKTGNIIIIIILYSSMMLAVLSGLNDCLSLFDSSKHCTHLFDYHHSDPFQSVASLFLAIEQTKIYISLDKPYSPSSDNDDRMHRKRIYIFFFSS